MKTKTALMLSFALITWCGITRGQNSPPAGSPPPAPAAEAPGTNTASAPVAAEAPVPAAPIAQAASTNLDATAPVAPDKPAAPAQGDSQESTNASSADQVEITLQPDATLPNAIQLLARMAKINFQFDPSLLSGTDEKGNPLPVPVIGVEIHWKGVTAAQALDALLENNSWQLISDSKTGIARITRKDPKAVEPMATKVVQLRYTNPTNLVAQLTNMVSRMAPGSMLVPDLRTSQIILVAPERHAMVLESLIQRLDTPTKQVLIEARLLETTRNPKSIKGIDWSGTLEGQNFSFGNGSTSGKTVTTTTSSQGSSVRGDGTVLPGSTVNNVNQQSTVTTLTGPNALTGAGGLSMDTLKGFNPATAFLNADGMHAVLSFINSDTESDQQALPRTVAQDGVETELAVIQNVPVFEQQQSPGVGGSQPLTTVRPVYNETVGPTIINEVGVKLQVTPHVVGLTNVQLDLRPEISDQDPVPAQFTLNGTINTSPVFNRRKIITQATVPSGYTLVLGGLKHDFATTTYKKVPILGDIPGLGILFRHENKSRTKQNLMIFVTPTIIEDSDFQATKTEFLKSRFVDKPDVPESAWDSAKPKDWTKPKPGVEPTYQPVGQ